MTRTLVALTLLLALVCACGKYGPPVRTGTAVTASHPADCDDPEHEHEEDREWHEEDREWHEEDRE